MSLVLVTGATGMIGPRVVEEFVRAGFGVRTLSSDTAPEGLLPGGVEARTGDVADPDVVRRAVEGCERVVHLAALLHLVDPSPRLRLAYERTNVEGTRVVIEAAREAGVRRVVFSSTIAVYGEAAGRVLSEDVPLDPRTLYAVTKAAAERVVLGARGHGGEPLGVVLRPGSVYGARVKGNYRRLVEALARRRFVQVGRGLNRRAMVYDRDVANAVLLATTRPAAAGRIYNISDGEEHRLSEIIEAISEALGRRPPRWHLPLAPVRAALGLAEGAARLTRLRSSVSRSMLDKYTEDMAVDSTRIRNELGFAPRYTLRAGWAEAVAAMRAEGSL